MTPEMNEAMKLLERAWGVIANAGEGNWTENERPVWVDAAKSWRDDFHEFAFHLGVPVA